MEQLTKLGPNDLMRALAPEIHWKQAYPMVTRAVIEHFVANPDAQMSSAQLADTLLPPILLRGVSGHYLRQRLFRALMTGAGTKHLGHYATKSTLPSERKGWGGKEKYPWIWHAFDPAVKPEWGLKSEGEVGQHCCPSCGCIF